MKTKRFNLSSLTCIAIAMAMTTGSSFGVTNDELPGQMPGLALAEQTANVSAVVSERLLEMHVKEGQRVRKGQLLATLNFAIQRAEFEAAKAIAEDTSGVKIAMVDVKEAESRLQRFRRALISGAGNQMELTNAENEYKKAVSILEQAQSQHVRARKTAETAEARLESYLIRAPFDGMVTEQHVSIGNLVEAGATVVTVVAPAKLRVELNLSLDLFGKLQKGIAYEMSAGAPVSKVVPAELVFVSPVIDSASQTFRCVFEIDNSDFQLPAGFPIQLSKLP